MQNLKRQIAYKVKIKDLLIGEYVKKEGWEPSYILHNEKRITRINIIGLLIYIDDTRIIIDDGSGNIEARFFEEKKKSSIDIGDVILLIGKPRMWNDEKYIVPEIIKKVKNKDWFLVWKKEVDFDFPIKKKEISIDIKKEIVEQIQEEKKEIFEGKKEDFTKTPAQKIIKIIMELDQGKGAEMEEIISKSNINGCEKFISNLINEGELFQISPGKIKVLD